MMCKCKKNAIHLSAKDVFITKQADTMDATATAADILEGVTAYSKNTKLMGTIPVVTAQATTLDDKDDVYTIPVGYHDGNGTVSLASTETENLIPANIVEGVTLFGVSGSAVLTNDATATESSVLSGETFYGQGSKKYGSMPNNGSTTLRISQNNVSVTIPQGYHDGTGVAMISEDEAAKIIPDNILKDVEILGVIGTVVRQTGDRLAGFINGTLHDLDLTGDNIGNIREYMFYNNTELYSIELPDNTETIGAYAFNGCSNLQSVTMSDSIDSIGTGAFWNCISLDSIDIPDGLRIIGSSAFRNTRIEKIWIPDSVVSIMAPGRANSPFYECSGLTDIYCESEVQPSGFGTYWNYTDSVSRATVHWGVSREEYEEL